VAIQAYTGTAQPFNFNGMVRHYYLRDQAWEGDLLVMLKDKRERERGSHEIAVAARALLTPLAHELGARIAVVEMPPGPPVLQTVVAEVYGPTAEIRRQVATDLTGLFEQAEGVVDVDNYMIEPYAYWHFEVDTEKAVRQGISVDTINRNIAMAMGQQKIGDVKRGTVQEPTYIVIQTPLSYRSEIATLGSLPLQSPSGQMVPLAELGRFVRQPEDPIVYHKDLRPMEYVVGEMEGRLGAPIYGMFSVEDLLADYDPPGPGDAMSGMPDGLIGPPATDAVADFEWTGEWTVTYETFRDMGLAFMAALVLIYGLIVWEFRDFALAGLIMSPIPLTLIGIIPGHLIMGAEFTATSMIGLIALGGIIVRQSILIVEFVKIEVARGKPVREAAVAGAEIRMRPILITSLTLMAGAWAIISDPIFQGMAVSLLFGAGVATLMAVIVIPLGCISLRRRFYLQETDSGEITLSPRYALVEAARGAGADVVVGRSDEAASGRWSEMDSRARPGQGAARGTAGTPLWLRLWSPMVSVLFAFVALGGRVFEIIKGIFGGLMDVVPGRKQAPATPKTPASPARPGASGRPGGEAQRAAPAVAAKSGKAPVAPTPPAAGSRAAPGPEPMAKMSEAPQSPTPAGEQPAARRAGDTAAPRKAPAKKAAPSRTAANKAASKKAATKKAAARKAPAKQTAATKAASPSAAKTPAATKTTAKRAAAKTAAKKASPKKPDGGS